GVPSVGCGCDYQGSRCAPGDPSLSGVGRRRARCAERHGAPTGTALATSMAMRTRGRGIPAMVLVFSTFAGVTNAADIALTDEGGTIVYTSRKWETPASVAEKFGVAPEDVPAFLEANGITRTTNLKDPIKSRVSNPLVRREQRAEERATTAEHELAV